MCSVVLQKLYIAGVNVVQVSFTSGWTTGNVFLIIPKARID